MKLEFFLLSYIVTRCIGVKLTPLENNDKLQDITNLFVAEWQWESWPVKQDLSEQEGRSPGQRKNVALWRDSSKSAWYLFGGKPVNGDPKKVYSDVWKFTIKTRMWKRYFPSQGEIKGVSISKTGGMATLQTKLFEKRNASGFESLSHTVILCGVLGEKNSTKMKNSEEWRNFRRKNLEEKSEELTHLAVYSPKSSKFNTVWQIDVKEKIWRAYVCCCDTMTNSSKSCEKENLTSIGTLEYLNKKDSGEKLNATTNSYPAFDSKINEAEDEVANEEQHLNIQNLKNKKKKINQMKKSNEKFHFKKINIEKKKYDRKERNETEINIEEGFDFTKNKTIENFNSKKSYDDGKKKKNILKAKNSSVESETNLKAQKPDDKQPRLKVSSNYCPELVEGGTFVSWCDGKNEALLSVDVNSLQITVWVYNLRTSHWSQLQIDIKEEVKWPGCSNTNSIRYAGNEDEVFIICSQSRKPNDTLLQSSINFTKIPSEINFNKKSVYRINYKKRVLRSLGEIRLNFYFNSIEGEEVWQDDTRSNLQVFRNSENETILMLAYLDMVDLWILNKDSEGKEGFELIEKVWRGSALKWFDKYNAVLYSFQFVSESGISETILLPNPRSIGANEYWPRERGRFIIRIFRNENLKNQSFENRTREQNLTYELLQSDYKPSGVEHQLNHMYSLKVIVFFGISLAIFSAFGFIVFLKKCVNCPPRIRIRNECHKSPLIIRYSVIPDDMLYPVA